MAQQIIDKYAPLVKVSDTESMPAAAIGGQTRDGKDEIITGAGNMVWNGTMWVPVDANNPLHTKAQDLEQKIEALTDEVEKLTALIQGDALKTQLTGSLPASVMELYGATAAERPAPDSVPVGAAYVAVRTLEVWMSDGTQWLEVD